MNPASIRNGMLKHAGTYEIMTPESVGLSRSTLVMGKHSGRHAFRSKLKELGFDLGDNALEDAFRRFKELADKKKDVYDEDITALVDDAVVRSNDRIRFVSLQVIAGSKGRSRPISSSKSTARRWKPEPRATGRWTPLSRPSRPFPHEARLQLFQVNAVTAGTDAPGRGDRPPGGGGQDRQWPGRRYGYAGRLLQAYIHALNKLLVKRQKTAPAALSA